MCRDQPAIQLHPQDYLAPVGTPVLVETRRHHPRAIEVDALGWPLTINLASTAAGSAVGAPYSRRLVESVDPNELAAQANSPRNFVRARSKFRFARLSPGNPFWKLRSSFCHPNWHILRPLSVSTRSVSSPESSSRYRFDPVQTLCVRRIVCGVSCPALQQLGRAILKANGTYADQHWCAGWDRHAVQSEFQRTVSRARLRRGLVSL